MSRKYYLEEYEWDNTWSDSPDNLSAKRVLYIGDSISCGTKHIVTQRCNKRVLFDGFGTSKGLDNPYFIPSLELFVKQIPKVDKIIFNNGLHGLHLTDDSEYKIYYEEMIKYLIKTFPDLPIYIVLTTYTQNEHFDSHVVPRNNVATEIAQKYSLPVIDVYSVTKQNSHLLTDDGVHFKPEGYEIIADTINEAMNN